MSPRSARILILCKTYPSPSAKHIETACVAGMEESGDLIRLFPIPFRLVSDDRQFKKWQWITAVIQKARSDHRRESYKVFLDTIELDGSPLPTRRQWSERLAAIAPLQIFDSFVDLEASRLSAGTTLGIVKPARVVSLEISDASIPQWTPKELGKLRQNRPMSLFGEEPSLSTLRKMPYDFHYNYECTDGVHVKRFRHKIVDWEIGALFWNCRRRYHARWEEPFRKKIEEQLPDRDLMLMLGTVHRFPDQWLIVSLIYPPKGPAGLFGVQGSLF